MSVGTDVPGVVYVCVWLMWQYRDGSRLDLARQGYVI